MPTPAPEKLLVEIGGVVHELNQLGRQFDGIGEIIPQTSVAPPKRLLPAELAFFKVISWLYASCFETGKVGVRYLLDFYCKAYLQDAAQAKAALDAIQNLRTLLQHHLDFASPRDLVIDRRCGDWFVAACGTAVPNTSAHWKKCLRKVLHDSRSLFERLVVALRDIEAHSARDQLVATWRFRKLRYRAPHEFDAVIQVVAADIGRDAIDIEKFRSRNYDRWVRALADVREEANVDVEIRRMVESSLLAEELRVLPITGADIMECFQLPPGPAVGELLRRAKSIYDSSPCSRDALLEALKSRESRTTAGTAVEGSVPLGNGDNERGASN